MNSTIRVHFVVLMTILAFSAASPCCYGQATEKLDILASPVSENVAVRFFFNPGNYFHSPLILRVASSKDPLLNKAPQLREGRTAYISAQEMQSLLQGLRRAGLSWKESTKQVSFEDATKILPVFYGISVVVASSNGTAETGIDPEKICGILAPLDSALKTPRALWEFQEYRTEYKCKIPGFNYQAYPDHWPWSK